jgi:hypothetical protein
MKSREFWIEKQNLAIQLYNRGIRKAEVLSEEITLGTRLQKTFYERQGLDQKRAKLAALLRGQAYLEARVKYYEERVVALENRSRFDRILRSPVI